MKDGKRRAKALKSTCEADFAQLRSWFTTTGGFGPKNRVAISIIRTGLGTSGKYQTGGATWIQINGFDGKANKDLADGWSDSEGLSRASMELL